MESNKSFFLAGYAIFIIFMFAVYPESAYGKTIAEEGRLCTPRVSCDSGLYCDDSKTNDGFGICEKIKETPQQGGGGGSGDGREVFTIWFNDSMIRFNDSFLFNGVFDSEFRGLKSPKSLPEIIFEAFLPTIKIAGIAGLFLMLRDIGRFARRVAFRKQQMVR